LQVLEQPVASNDVILRPATAKSGAIRFRVGEAFGSDSTGFGPMVANWYPLVGVHYLASVADREEGAVESLDHGLSGLDSTA
jgi:hypothetical protein